MTIKTESRICWTLVNANGSDYSEHHYGGEAEAAEQAETLGETGLHPSQLAAPCLTVTCDGPGCGEKLENHDYDAMTLHLPNENVARHEAQNLEWEITPAGAVRCCDCVSEYGPEATAS